MAYIRKTQNQYIIQQYTGYRWEDICIEESRREANMRIRECQENQPEYPVRTIVRKIKIEYGQPGFPRFRHDRRSDIYLGTYGWGADAWGFARDDYYFRPIEPGDEWVIVKRQRDYSDPRHDRYQTVIYYPYEVLRSVNTDARKKPGFPDQSVTRAYKEVLSRDLIKAAKNSRQGA